MQRQLYLLVYPIIWLISKMPFWLLYLKSDMLYFLLYYIVGYRKKVIKQNLQLAFPEKLEAERNLICKKFYKHLCDLIFEAIKGMTITEKELGKRYTFENLEVLKELHKKQKSVLLMSGHYANWEWSGVLNNQNSYKNYAVYKKIENPYFDSFVKNLRERFGATLIKSKHVIPALYRSVKKDILSVTLIISDQSPRPDANGHRDLFMGIDVPVYTGTESLAKKLDFATVYFKVEKVKRGFYSVRFIPLAEDPNTKEDFEITRLFLNELEAQIRKHPEYYLWSHRRWKYRKTEN
ncbi:lysophospholipid acyltransferase family protein [Cochleicola gelatinilyticus]|uniref:Lipid A biosynthesis acyltransferase n=1 Tax=Cochleicola gelatinilyticus TaxID=1763537 RepID=A0A167GAR1_9FLAO|nr:lysophospholipid acyltransferase family protein [Cochleicola gelatinilyticus]OAB77393.1 lipid A biosynthesis acyltransferase [Cochleicola gelatinilyticus]